MRTAVRHHLARAARLPTMRPAYAAGIRAAIATIGPMVIGDAVGHPSAGMWMGLAGFNVSLGDKGGSRRTRFRAMSASLIFGAFGAAAGAVAGRHGWSAVLVGALWALGAGLARSWGQPSANAGVVSLATFVISISAPLSSMVETLERGAAYIAGGALAMVLALLVWRTRPYRTARLAVARAYDAIAAQAPDARDSIDQARMTLAAVRRGLQGELPRGERLLVLLERGHQMLPLVRTADQTATTALKAIGRAIERERNDELNAVNAPEGPLHDRIANAVTITRELNDDRPRSLFDAAQVDWRREYVEPLAGNLTWESVVLRHALRVAVATAAAIAMTSALHTGRAYWVVFSVIVVLQPYTSATFQKGLQRIGGTIAGGVIAAVLLALIRSRAEMLVIIFAGAAATVALMPLNYALYSLFLTPTFVLLAEANGTDWHLIWLRVANTLAGAAIAYVAAWILWPASERGLIRDDLVTTLRNLGEYVRCFGECDDLHMADAYRAYIVAVQNADASVQRQLGEASAREVEPLIAILTYVRRFTEALQPLPSAAANRMRLWALTKYASDTLHQIADAIESSRPPAPLPDDASALRVAGASRLLDPLIAMHDAAGRLATSPL